MKNEVHSNVLIIGILIFIFPENPIIPDNPDKPDNPGKNPIIWKYLETMIFFETKRCVSTNTNI